eukprot:2508884-Amphidinium_carterae.1
MGSRGRRYYGQSLRTAGATVQTCAELCAMYRADTDGGWCRYFMFYHQRDSTDPSTCQLWVPATTLGDPEVGHEECDDSVLEYQGSACSSILDK